MTIARNELPPVSWDDLLSAISPRRGLTNADLQRAVAAVAAAQQEGRITDKDAAELIKALAAVAMSGQVNAMVGDFFTPDTQGRLGVRFGGGGFSQYGPRFTF